MKTHRRAVYFFAVFLQLLAAACLAAPAQPVASPPQPPPVILVSLDGFRNSYIPIFAAPNMTQLAREGVRAKAMTPCFPSLTFPCHYTLVTGWHPAEHGIVANRVAGPVAGDAPLTMSTTPQWWRWRGEPIWITAEKQGVKTATMFWPSSYDVIDGHRPTYWHTYNSKFSYRRRVEQILAWLDLPAAQRPRFMTLYMEAVDEAGHASGPDSGETAKAVVRVDTTLGLLVQGLKKRKLYDAVNLIVTADHGMSATNAQRFVFVSDALDIRTVKTQSGGPYMLVAAKKGDAAAVLERLRKLPHVRAYLKKDIPAHLNFRNHTLPFDILLLADDGWVVLPKKTPEIETERKLTQGRTSGRHGYDNGYESMKAVFIAHGPAFKPGAPLGEISSVDVYPLLAHLLHITPAKNSGRLDAFAQVLRIR